MKKMASALLCFIFVICSFPVMANAAYEEIEFGNEYKFKGNDTSITKYINLNKSGKVKVDFACSFYKETLEQNGDFTITPSGGSYTFCLLDIDNNEIVSYNNGTGPFAMLGRVNPFQDYIYLSAGTYKFAVTASYIEGSYNIDYYSSNETYPDYYQNDNNNIYKATSISNNEFVSGILANNDKVDYYKFVVDRESFVNINVKYFSNFLTPKSNQLAATTLPVKPQNFCQVLNSNENTISYKSYSSEEKIMTDDKYTMWNDFSSYVLNPGIYFLKIEGSGVNDYDFTIKTQCVNHIFNNGVITKSATCTSIGTKLFTCTICGETNEEIISMDSHTYKVTKATLSKNGAIVCEKCKSQKETIYSPNSFILSKTSYIYDGKEKKPTVTVKTSDGKTLKQGTDYLLSYSKGRKSVGKHSVKITLKGNYSGSKTIYFTIKPKTTTISSLSAISRKGFTVKWQKQKSQTSGYQIQIATDKEFSKNVKNYTISSNSTVSKKITNLKSNKKYYVRVRTYKSVSGSNYYSSWSQYKNVKTKK